MSPVVSGVRDFSLGTSCAIVAALNSAIDTNKQKIEIKTAFLQIMFLFPKLQFAPYSTIVLSDCSFSNTKDRDRLFDWNLNLARELKSKRRPPDGSGVKSTRELARYGSKPIILDQITPVSFIVKHGCLSR